MTGIPNRLCVDDLSNGFPEMRRRLDIFLDGELQHHVLAYDIDKGEVERIVTDDEGRMALNAAGDAMQTETITGKVAVQLRESARAPN